MKHFNFSSEWRISDTDSGRRVLSPLPAEGREYSALTDIAVHGALTLETRSELKCFEYDNRKTFHDMSYTLSPSFPTDKFAVQFFNNRGAKIEAVKDTTKRALLTLTLPSSAKIYRTNNVLIKFYRGDYLYFAAIMNDGDEVNVVFLDDTGEKLELRTYAFEDGCMNIYNN